MSTSNLNSSEENFGEDECIKNIDETSIYEFMFLMKSGRFADFDGFLNSNKFFNELKLLPNESISKVFSGIVGFIKF